MAECVTCCASVPSRRSSGGCSRRGVRPSPSPLPRLGCVARLGTGLRNAPPLAGVAGAGRGMRTSVDRSHATPELGSCRRRRAPGCRPQVELGVVMRVGTLHRRGCRFTRRSASDPPSSGPPLRDARRARLKEVPESVHEGELQIYSTEWNLISCSTAFAGAQTA